MNRNKLNSIMALVITAGTAACGILEPDNDERERLNDAIGRWTAQGIGSYEYRLTQLCFCPQVYVQTYLVRIYNGALAEIRHAETGAAPPDNYRWRTIPGLFDLIDQAIDEDVDRLEVDYHEQLGYPTRISIDFDRLSADEELTVRAEALIPVR